MRVMHTYLGHLTCHFAHFVELSVRLIMLRVRRRQSIFLPGGKVEMPEGVEVGDDLIEVEHSQVEFFVLTFDKYNIGMGAGQLAG
jgi:hypothetical protein